MQQYLYRNTIWGLRAFSVLTCYCWGNLILSSEGVFEVILWGALAYWCFPDHLEVLFHTPYTVKKAREDLLKALVGNPYAELHHPAPLTGQETLTSICLELDGYWREKHPFFISVLTPNSWVTATCIPFTADSAPHFKVLFSGPGSEALPAQVMDYNVQIGKGWAGETKMVPADPSLQNEVSKSFHDTLTNAADAVKLIYSPVPTLFWKWVQFCVTSWFKKDN